MLEDMADKYFAYISVDKESNFPLFACYADDFADVVNKWLSDKRLSIFDC